MTKKPRFSLSLCLFAALLLVGVPVHAQEAQQQRPEQFSSAATAVDAVNLLTGTYMISLWGIQPLEAGGAVLSIKARTALDNLIAGQPVRCEVKEWRGQRPIARCLNAREADLALAMLQAGYAMADRNAIVGTVFDAQYKAEEARAQESGLGGWAVANQGTDFLKYFGGSEALVSGWILSVLVLPLCALVLMGAIVAARIGRLERYIGETVANADTRQKELRDQERFVVAGMIESEMSANKGKLEAFIIIYKDLLKSLRQSREHRYQTNGEIVHDAPLLERIVFDSNISRLDLLGANMASELVGLYSLVQSNPNYTTLDSSIPVDDAILKVQKVVADAESLVPRIDKIIQSLHVTIRDKQTRQVRSSR